MVSTIHHGIIAREIDPVLVTSAERLIGIDTLLEFIVDYGPNPLERAFPPVSAGEAIPISADGPLVAYVFKTISDPFVGRIYLFRYSQSRPGPGVGSWWQGSPPQSLQAAGQRAS